MTLRSCRLCLNFHLTTLIEIAIFERGRLRKLKGTSRNILEFEYKFYFEFEVEFEFEFEFEI